jgi:membrane-associated protease RseP (regulator of RpoE activity)
MSLPESFTDLSGAQASQSLSPETAAPPPDHDLLRLREALTGILTIAGEQHAHPRRGSEKVYIFRGRLQLPPQDAYKSLTERFKPVGYSPMLQREHDEDVVIALEGDIPQRRFRSPWWLHLALLLITMFTTTVMGAALTGMPPSETYAALRAWNIPTLWPILRDGLPFSLTLLTILGVHEMGHYIAGRLHGVKVTLPYFIPLPISNSLGTMGAVIFIKSPLMNRRALFDVGIAGPLAGLIVAIPLYMIGLQQAATVGGPLTWQTAGIHRVANPPLLEAIASLVVDVNNLDKYVFIGHPMALAAWFGVLLTALNLLPLGQFDGGHVAYALLGRRAWPLATLTFGLLFLLGITGAWFAWLIWAFMGLLTGLRHPPPFDDLSPLGRVRIVIGLVTAVLFCLIIVPVPFYAP